MDFPFELEITRKRVKNLRLRVLSAEKVALTLPWFVSKGQGLKFVSEHRAWIEKARNQKIVHGAHFFAFQGIAYTLALRPDQTLGTVRFKADTVEIGAANETAARRAFQQFILTEAKRVLPLELAALSVRTGLVFTRLTIRTQKTRWGSCSARKAISLNSALMKLSSELREYVLIHELCHTRIMNHSARFWSLVAEFCPEYRMKRRAIRKFGLGEPE